MWPQKWYASASPGLISEPAVRAPATVISPPATRERKPRRELPSGTQRSPPPLGGRQHGLELRARVERPLGEHGPVAAERDRERTAGDVGHRPRAGVLDLVEAPHGDPRVAREGVDDRFEPLADAAPLGGEHREPDPPGGEIAAERLDEP